MVNLKGPAHSQKHAKEYSNPFSLSICASSCSQQSPSGVDQKVKVDDNGAMGTYFNASWAMDTLWDDGLAEAAV